MQHESPIFIRAFRLNLVTRFRFAHFDRDCNIFQFLKLLMKMELPPDYVVEYDELVEEFSELLEIHSKSNKFPNPNFWTFFYELKNRLRSLLQFFRHFVKKKHLLHLLDFVTGLKTCLDKLHLRPDEKRSYLQISLLVSFFLLIRSLRSRSKI